MVQEPRFSSDYRPQFSGHETFPLRYGWLKKVHDAVRENETATSGQNVFLSDNAIARFGVGKNMVSSMRHWAHAVDVIEESSALPQTTELGRKIFDDNGLDPYLENTASLWLLHWQLASRQRKTTWYWAFNHFSSASFERQHIIAGLTRLAKDKNWNQAAEITLKNDVACFLRTYVVQRTPTPSEDSIESPLAELGLIKATEKRDSFRFVRGPKPTLGMGVFTYALLDFWQHTSSAATLSFEAVTYAPGSPGRVFLLDEDDITDRLTKIHNFNPALKWSETAGLKQLIKRDFLDSDRLLDHIDIDCSKTIKSRAA